jgi:hypothetical protein
MATGNASIPSIDVVGEPTAQDDSPGRVPPFCAECEYAARTTVQFW